MTDEQPVPIYLSPEEELTSVRERLEQTQARRIILVIPPQTQLRSHVGWRLIHARMRELGKDLLVISPDRQVRAVARAAGFRVAESQESPSNRSRLGSSSTRPGSVNTRGAARSRIGSSRSGPDSRIPGSQSGARRQTPAPGPRSLPPLPPERNVYEDEVTLERARPQPLELEDSQSVAPAPTLPKESDTQKRSLRDFHISTTPSVRPSVPGRLEDDDDDDADEKKYYEDYHTAQRIRESASASGSAERGNQDDFPAERGSRGAVSRDWKNDPFVYMQDEEEHLPLPEQKGSMPGLFDEIGTNVPDISDRSTEIMESEIEDLGDMGAITPPKITALPRPPTPSRELGQRPRRPSGQIRPHSPRSPRPGSQDLDDDDELLAIPDRPTQAGRPSRGLTGNQRPSQGLRSGSSQRPSQGLRPGPRSSQSLKSSQAVQGTQRPSQALKSGPTTQSNQRPSQALKSSQAVQGTQRPSQALRPGQIPQSNQRARPTATGGQRQPVLAPAAPRQPISRQRRPRRSSRGLTVIFTILVLVLIVIGLLFYFVPTATVTISLQAQNYSQAVQLNASLHPPSGAANGVQAQMLEHDFSASGQGNASGQTKVGDTPAQGLVTFTNNGATDVTIPTGTMIATQSGIPFATSAEALVPHGASQQAVPVSAQQKGVAGNVPANSLTSIPASSLNSIAQYNHISASALSLTVTNPQATSGGGARNVPAVTQGDLQALKNTLHKDLQQQIKTWLTAQTHSGDLHGTPLPNVPASANPLADEQFSGTPPVGQAESSGVFPGTLAVHIKVLFARAADIKNAASSLMKTTVPKTHVGFMLAQLPVTLSNEKGVASQDGNSLAISTQASGGIIRQIDTQGISANLTGKSVAQAASDLKSSLARSGVQDVQINVTPSFLGIMPWQAGRIQIQLQPVQSVPVKHVPNG